MTARELGTYVQAAWATYEDMREQRDEALCRVDELTDQRDQARRIAAALEQENARLAAKVGNPKCRRCGHVVHHHARSIKHCLVCDCEGVTL